MRRRSETWTARGKGLCEMEDVRFEGNTSLDTGGRQLEDEDVLASNGEVRRCQRPREYSCTVDVPDLEDICVLKPIIEPSLALMLQPLVALLFSLPPRPTPSHYSPRLHHRSFVRASDSSPIPCPSTTELPSRPSHYSRTQARAPVLAPSIPSSISFSRASEGTFRYLLASGALHVRCAGVPLPFVRSTSSDSLFRIAGHAPPSLRLVFAWTQRAGNSQADLCQCL